MLFPIKVKVEGRVEEGDPGDVICEMVKVLKADLLVTGSHGYGQLTRYKLTLFFLNKDQSYMMFAVQ